jgi:hypothetical protein
MKKFTAEVAIGKNEIENIEFVTIQDPAEASSRSMQNTPSTSSSLLQSGTTSHNNDNTTTTSSFVNKKSPESNLLFAKPFKPVLQYNNQNYKTTTKPIAIVAKPTTSKNFRKL